MRKEMIYKYLLVGVFIYLVDIFYRIPKRLPRFLLILVFTTIVGSLIERLYYYMLARKKIKILGRLIIIIPLSVMLLLSSRYIIGQYEGYKLYAVLLTIISVVILDQINYQIYRHNYNQVNKQLMIIKNRSTHKE